MFKNKLPYDKKLKAIFKAMYKSSLVFCLISVALYINGIDLFRYQKMLTQISVGLFLIYLLIALIKVYFDSNICSTKSKNISSKLKEAKAAIDSTIGKIAAIEAYGDFIGTIDKEFKSLLLNTQKDVSFNLSLKDLLASIAQLQIISLEKFDDFIKNQSNIVSSFLKIKNQHEVDGYIKAFKKHVPDLNKIIKTDYNFFKVFSMMTPMQLSSGDGVIHLSSENYEIFIVYDVTGKGNIPSYTNVKFYDNVMRDFEKFKTNNFTQKDFLKFLVSQGLKIVDNKNLDASVIFINKKEPTCNVVIFNSSFVYMNDSFRDIITKELDSNGKDIDFENYCNFSDEYIQAENVKDVLMNDISNYDLNNQHEYKEFVNFMEEIDNLSIEDYDISKLIFLVSTTDGYDQNEQKDKKDFLLGKDGLFNICKKSYDKNDSKFFINIETNLEKVTNISETSKFRLNDDRTILIIMPLSEETE